MMAVIGIDPGANGGVCDMRWGTGVFDLDITWGDGVFNLTPMPMMNGMVDIKKLCQMIPPFGTVYVEDYLGWGPSKVTAVVQAGNFYGVLYACQIIGVTPIRVGAKAWKKTVLGDKYDHKDKAGTIQWAKDTYSGVSLLDPNKPRSKKDHDGMADALAIAHYGKMQYAKV